MSPLARPPHAASPGTDLGHLLRHWRALRGRSQLDVSVDTGISQRHISFVESGRSVPSRPTLLALARALDVPLRERNALLLAAGYAPAYAEAPLEADEMRTVTRALERMLRQHEPYPALVLDRHWNVRRANAAAPRFFGRFADLSRHPAPRNLLRLVFDPAGLRPAIADWARTAPALLERVRREAVGGALDEGTRALLASLQDLADVPADGASSPSPLSSLSLSSSSARDAGPVLPVIPIGFRHAGRVLNYFSMVATVGTPQAVGAQELRLECMVPADDATEAAHAELMAG